MNGETIPRKGEVVNRGWLLLITSQERTELYCEKESSKEHRESFVSFEEEFMYSLIFSNVSFVKFQAFTNVEIGRGIYTFSQLSIVVDYHKSFKYIKRPKL